MNRRLLYTPTSLVNGLKYEILGDCSINCKLFNFLALFYKLRTFISIITRTSKFIERGFFNFLVRSSWKKNHLLWYNVNSTLRVLKKFSEFSLLFEDNSLICINEETLSFAWNFLESKSGFHKSSTF